MDHFHDFSDNIFVDNYDVYMRLFLSLLVASFGTMDELETTFMIKLGVKRDNHYYVTKFLAIK